MIGFIFGLAISLNAEEVARIIAKVNNQVVTTKDLDDYCKVLQLRLTDDDSDFSSDQAEFRKTALQRLIEDKLILQEAKRKRIEIPRVAIDERLNKIVDSHPSYEAFNQSLIEKGLTVTALKEKINEQYLMRELINMEVRSQVAVSPQEISSYYAANKDKILSSLGYVFYIASSDEKRRLLEIRQLIKAEGLAAAVRDYDDDLVKMESSKDELKKEMVAVLEKLRPGEMEVAKMDDLDYLLYLEEVVEPKQLKLEEAQEQINAYLSNMKFKLRFSKWIKDLKERAVIKIYDE